MAKFEVWAPKARTVAVKLGDRTFPMDPGEGGWWSASIAEAGPGTDYAFVLDGGKPLPDPRSPFQPEGVHGPSRLVDQAAFRWTDAGFQAGPLASGLVYELHIGTFTPEGTFEAAISRLDHLVELGITHVELMPVVQFPGWRGWGYDGVDIYAPHRGYGGPEGLKRLVDACHSKGLAVLLDVVYNHLGPDGNYLGQYGPYYSTVYNTPWGDALNFDGQGSDEVRRFFIDNARMWLRDYHFDGLRLDAVHAIIDTSAVHFLEQLAAEIDALEIELGRHLVLVAESDLNDPRLVRPPEVGGYGLDAQWSDDFRHSLHTVLTGEHNRFLADFGSLADLATALKQAYVYAGRYSSFRGRRHGRLPTGVPAYRFLGYLQNHDQVGNRARGERIGHLVSTDLLKVAAALVLASPFVPMLFMGEEWGASTPFLYFTDHEDPELARSVSEGRKTEFSGFGWDPQDIPDPQSPQTFQRSKLNWEELDREPHASLLEWHRDLIRLRREVPYLSAGGFAQVQVSFSEDDRWLVLERGPVKIACNLSDRLLQVPLRLGSGDHVRMASHPEVALHAAGISLPPASVGIILPG